MSEYFLNPNGWIRIDEEVAGSGVPAGLYVVVEKADGGYSSEDVGRYFKVSESQVRTFIERGEVRKVRLDYYTRYNSLKEFLENYTYIPPAPPPPPDKPIGTPEHIDYIIEGQVTGSLIPLSLGDGDDIFAKINIALERFTGWSCTHVHIENNGFFSIGLRETGSVAIGVIVLVILGILGLAFVVYRITYAVTKVSDNQLLEEKVDNQDQIVQGLTKLRAEGIISEDTFDQLMSQIIDTPVIPPSDNGGFGTPEITIAAAAAIALIAVMVLKK